ncbi:cyclic pyranopterin monophosphate synthase MoaC [Pseudothermotoga thermarum]|uniref:Cyclic pyranopterin monophosphate synthase n=1 Tax=Pseudothermotoga thermarum DSM 5069 TaxID=688269 RepID=F7YXI4_9THEM|nr:cyclic pyranopterin monophosphate synthase MoaC [Pseudothermotoga thermarum]AEH50625.1 GTP cyclohydrolase subunit MoaC [Pseudothermotoga thermarum DSM 5069]
MVEKFSHIDESRNVHMVDVTFKQDSERIAVAHAKVKMKKETLQAILQDKIAKGNVLTTAKVAAIMAAKKTSDLIPMCHNINLTHVDVNFSFDEEQNFIEIKSTVKCVGKTGAEMEALTAAAIAALTIYDMCKAIDKTMEICEIYLLEKSGGKSGEYRREDNR